MMVKVFLMRGQSIKVLQKNKVRLSLSNALCICVENSFEFWVRFELLIHRPKEKSLKTLCIDKISSSEGTFIQYC